MSNKKDILTDALRDRLKDYSHPVPDDMWEKIEKDLSSAPIRKSKKIPFRRLIAAAAVIALFIGSGIFLINHDFRDNNIISEQIPAKDTSDISSKRSERVIETHKDKPVQATEVPNIERKEAKKIMISEKTDPQNIAVSDLPEREVVSNDQKEEPIQPREENKTDEKESKKSNTPEQKRTPAKTPYKLPNINRTKDNNISFALAVGNSGTISSNSAGTGYYAMNSVVNEYLNQDQLKNNINYTETDYKMPLSVGLSVRKHFSEKWALESGLVYTYLSSTERTKAAEVTITKRDIDLSYIGIPIKGVFSFYNTKNISLYATAGGMAEMCVYGKETINGDRSNTLDVSEIQWSVFGNVGINYRLINHLGIFVEPGVGYYFDDGGDIETIRKDSPFNFNIQAGIRLTY